jgi:hypothetical protein
MPNFLSSYFFGFGRRHSILPDKPVARHLFASVPSVPIVCPIPAGDESWPAIFVPQAAEEKEDHGRRRKEGV